NTVDGVIAMGDAIHNNWGSVDKAVWGILFTGVRDSDEIISFSDNTVSNVEDGFVLSAPANVALAANSFSGAEDAIHIRKNVDADSGVELATGGTGNVAV